MIITDGEQREFKEKLLKEHEKDFNTLVLLSLTVHRLISIDFASDGEFEFIFQRIDGTLVQPSVLVGYLPLKNRLSKKEYNHLEYHWKMNFLLIPANSVI